MAGVPCVFPDHVGIDPAERYAPEPLVRHRVFEHEFGRNLPGFGARDVVLGDDTRDGLVVADDPAGGVAPGICGDLLTWPLCEIVMEPAAFDGGGVFDKADERGLRWHETAPDLVFGQAAEFAADHIAVVGEQALQDIAFAGGADNLIGRLRDVWHVGQPTEGADVGVGERTDGRFVRWRKVEPVNVLLLTGAPGVGKTSLAEEMFDQLWARNVRHAVIDVDALCISYPFRPGDPFNNLTALENVRAVWRNFAAQGIDRLILVRVVEDQEDVRALTDAVPGAVVVVCQLVAGPSTVEQRLRRREVGSSTDSLVARGRELAEAGAGDGLADIVVETEGIALPQVALNLLRTAEWLPAVDEASD